MQHTTANGIRFNAPCNGGYVCFSYPGETRNRLFLNASGQPVYARTPAEFEAVVKPWVPSCSIR